MAFTRGVSSWELNKCELQEVAAMLGIGKDQADGFALTDVEVNQLRVEAASRGEVLTAEQVPGFINPSPIDPRLLFGMLDPTTGDVPATVPGVLVSPGVPSPSGEAPAADPRA